MIKRFAILAALVALVGIGGVRLAPQNSVSAASEVIYGLTSDNSLVVFTKTAPGTVESSVAIAGLQPGERLLGIDVRPATNELYGLGSTSRLYRLNGATGVATPIGAPFAPLLEGQEFGFDFNPTVDRIRIVSDAGQNLRAHPDTGEVVAVDGDLAYVQGDANFGETPMIVAAAYTNPDNDPATGTALFNIDGTGNWLALQDPPNDGGLQSVGSLGLPAATSVRSFDMGTNPPDALLVGKSGPGDLPSLYRVNLETGAATLVGGIGADVVSIAIQVDAAPAPPTPTPTAMPATPTASPTPAAATATPTTPAPMPPNTGSGLGENNVMSLTYALFIVAASVAISVTLLIRGKSR